MSDDRKLDPAERFTVEEIDYSVTRAGQLVYGSDERLDELVEEVHRFLRQELTKRE